MLKIALVGPESSGKTTLCKELAAHYRMPWVPEFAREFLGSRAGAYAQADLMRIAEGQCLAEDRSAGDAPRLLFCDTDMINIRIWSEEKFGSCDPLIVELSETRHYDHWLLCRPDLPWDPDPLRENPHDRDRLFDIHEAMLRSLKKPFSIIEGVGEKRLAHATALIEDLLVRSGV